MEEGKKFPRNRRRSSTRDVKLDGFLKYFDPEIRRNTSILDFDMSLLQHHKVQRESFPSLETVSIAPVPAEDIHQKPDKRVAFQLDLSPYKSKGKSIEHHFDFSKFVVTAEVLEDAIKYSLDHKDDLFHEYDSFLQFAFFGDGISETAVHHTRSEKKLGQKKEKSVVLEGVLSRLQPSENHIVKFVKRPSSRKVSLGGSPVPLSPEDLWSWPWLNPDLKARNLYRSLTQNKRVTFSQQAALPIIPLPSLGQSLNGLLLAVKPCTSARTLARTQKLVNDFANGEGSVYHEHIINSKEHPNTTWIREFLPNYSHCYTRLEAPLINTAIVAPFMYDLWPERATTQLTRAAILVELAVEFWELIRDERLLPIAVARDGKPACMHQFRKLFSSVKLPGIPRDEIYYNFKTVNEGGNTSRHIVVFYKGQIFGVEVVTSDNERVSSEIIKRRLSSVITSVDEGVSEQGLGLGILTSLDRNAWSELRVHLMEISLRNHTCLNEIEQAMFALSLDDTRGVGNTDRLLHEAIFADGCNRWYDKSFNFYVYSNGLVTMNVNTSIIDGTTAAILLHYIHIRIMEDFEKWDDDVLMSVSGSTADVHEKSTEEDDGDTDSQSVMSDVPEARNRMDSIQTMSYPGKIIVDSKPLVFDIDDKMEVAIEEAKVKFLEMACSIRTAVCRFEKYETRIFSQKDINTDAFAHLVMQLAFFRMYFRPPSVGSKVSLRRFRYGRYEVIRTTTCESVLWCKSMLDVASSFKDQSSQFFEAIKKHVSLLKDVCYGRGNENHLAALRVIAEDVYSTTPLLFQDEGFRQAGGFGRFDIYSECLGVGCTSCAVVWPASPVGYGVGYFVANSKIVFNVCSWDVEKGTSADLFAHSLTRTLNGLHEFLTSLPDVI